VAGRNIFISNRGTNPINIYPATGARIGALAVNVPVALAVGQSVEFFARSATQWEGQLSQPLNGNLTQFSGLVDPNADRILFWDDSAGVWEYLSLGTGLVINGTVLNTVGWTYIGSQVITNDATGLYTGLGSYRDIMLSVIGSTAVSAGNRRLRVGNSGSGILSTNIYRPTEGVAVSGFRVSTSASTNNRSFSIIINGFNTTDPVKPINFVGSQSSADLPVAVESAAALDRLQVTDEFGVNNINGGTMYLWGR
jgi:hypothetical protein